MNNLFLEGPVQTGKSTLIREMLQEFYGANACRSGSCNFEFCSAPDKVIGGFTVQRMHFPTPGENKRIGFRLMPASAPIKAHTCVTATDEDLLASEGVFKLMSGSGKSPGSSQCGSRVKLEVFETLGVQYIRQAIEDYRTGRISLVLLDEIGGHEMICVEFRQALYEILESDIPCIGVVKLQESARGMLRKHLADATGNGASARAQAILSYNLELHEKITGLDGEHGEIVYYDRADKQLAESARSRIHQFLLRFPLPVPAP